MDELEFRPENAIGQKLLEMDKQELLQFVSRLCLHIKGKVGARAYRGGIFPDNICTDGQGHFAIGPAKMEKWSGQELEFVAPELYWHGDCGPASDVYSLALLVYYGLNEGRLPFETATVSGQLARMSGKALPAPKAAGKRLGEVLEKATAFQAGDRYQTPEELQIMLESCMDNKYLGGSSGAQVVFGKDAGELSDVERMMVDIIESSPESEEAPAEIEDLASMTPEEQAGLEKPEPVEVEKEDIHAAVEEFFGSLTGDESPVQEEEEEVIRVYKPAREKKERQPIPILTEELYPELEPVVLQRQVPRPVKKQPEPRPQEQTRQEQAQQVRVRRNLRPLALALILCLSLVIGALGLNLYWMHSATPTQINPTPDPQRLTDGELPPAQQPTPQQTEQPAGVVIIPSPSPVLPRFTVTAADLSWTEAQQACYRLGGHLAVVRNSQDLAEIAALAEARGLTRIWVGCQRVSGQLVWENEAEVDYYNWGPGEPTVWDSYDDVPENYLMLYREGSTWYYNDNRNDPAGDYPDFYRGVMGYACEFEPR